MVDLDKGFGVTRAVPLGIALVEFGGGFERAYPDWPVLHGPSRR